MKLEARGKFGGVKIHLDAEECKAFLKQYPPQGVWIPSTANFALTFPRVFAKKLRTLLLEVPDLLKDKSPEQVAQVLTHEAEKAAAKLAALKKGEAWQEIH